MNSNSIGFQSYDEQFNIRLREIRKSGQKGHIVCVPNVFHDLSKFNERAKIFWEEYLRNNRSKIYKLLDMKKY
jgi:hypothetical protein